MSGYADNKVIQHGILGPDTAFLRKPFGYEALGAKDARGARGRRQAAGCEWMSVTASKSVTLLLIDDEESHLELIREALETEDLNIVSATTGRAGWESFVETRPHAVLLDLGLPDINGMDLLVRIVEQDPGVEVILVTGNYSIDAAVEAIRNGAADYITKPFDLEKLRVKIRKIVADRQRRSRASALERQLVDTFTFHGIVGRSPLMLELFDRVRRVAPHFQTALITGPTGTGKELVAKALHQLSPRAGQRFVVRNCSAIPESLMESELFGYARGAFTGATQERLGLFESADGGTIFLDEIGELSLVAQAKFLRVLQQREVQRLGCPQSKTVDIRVIAATNRDLMDLVREGSFREDLFYRLSMIEIKLPALIDRKEDLIFLTRHFVAQHSAKLNRNIRGITPRAQHLIARYSWPGNVRELENVIGTACILATTDVIDVPDLADQVRAPARTSILDDELISFDELQRRHARRVLARVDGNKARAAEILGVSRSTLYSLVKEDKKASVSHRCNKSEVDL